jgi:hypothetical protein
LEVLICPDEAQTFLPASTHQAHLPDVQNGKNTATSVTGLSVIFRHQIFDRTARRDGVGLRVTRFTGAAPPPVLIDPSLFGDIHAL